MKIRSQRLWPEGALMTEEIIAARRPSRAISCINNLSKKATCFWNCACLSSSLFASQRQRGFNFDGRAEINDLYSETTLTAIAPLYMPRDRLALETHFAALDGEDLRNRFCGSIKPACVMQYLDQLNGIDVASYGIFNPSRALVAVSQLGQSGGDLEVGISVLLPYRRKGFAKALLNHSASYARARGLKALIIHSLADNTPMAVARATNRNECADIEG